MSDVTTRFRKGFREMLSEKLGLPTKAEGTKVVSSRDDLVEFEADEPLTLHDCRDLPFACQNSGSGEIEDESLWALMGASGRQYFQSAALMLS